MWRVALGRAAGPGRGARGRCVREGPARPRGDGPFPVAGWLADDTSSGRGAARPGGDDAAGGVAASGVRVRTGASRIDP